MNSFLIIERTEKFYDDWVNFFFQTERSFGSRRRRLSAVGHHHALYLGLDLARALSRAELSSGGVGGLHQYGGDHADAWRRPAAGGLRDGAVGRLNRSRIGP